MSNFSTYEAAKMVKSGCEKRKRVTHYRRSVTFTNPNFGFVELPTGQWDGQMLVTVTHSYRNRFQTKPTFNLAETVETSRFVFA
jgi:hypothetical protein